MRAFHHNGSGVMKRLVSSGFLFVAVTTSFIHAAGAPRDAPVMKFRHVFLLDVSGSMRSSLGAPGSQTREFLAQSLCAIPDLVEEGQPVAIYSFSVPGYDTVLQNGPHNAARFRQIIEKEIQVSSHDTDMVHALGLARTALLHLPADEVGLVWLLTDNINDPHGSGGDVDETRRFYSALFDEHSELQRMYFFPMKDQKLVLYLMAYGADNTLKAVDMDHFEEMLGQIGTALKAPRIRAKPVGGDTPVEIDRNIQFQGGDGRNVTAEVIGTGRNRSLVIHGLKEGKSLAGRFLVHVRSRFDEWRIQDAHVEQTQLVGLESSEFPNISGQMSARLTPDRMSVDAHAVSTVVYSLDLGADDAPVPAAPFFTFAALFPDRIGRVRGTLVVRVGDPELKLQIFNDPATTEAVKNIFHLEDIEYFLPKKASVSELRLDFRQPVEFEVAYSPFWRWLAVFGCVGAVIVGGVFIRGTGSKAVYCRLSGYQEESFPLAGAARFQIAPGGKIIGTLSRGWSGTVICSPARGALVNGHKSPFGIRSGTQLAFEADQTSYLYTFEVVRAGAGTSSTQSAASGGYY